MSHMPSIGSLGSNQGVTLSLLDSCKKVLKILSIPLVLVVGPIIALVGMVVSWVKNTSICNQQNTLLLQKVKQYNQVKDTSSPAEVRKLEGEVFVLKKILQGAMESKTMATKGWGKRMIPLFYGSELIRSACCKSTPLQLLPGPEEVLSYKGYSALAGLSTEDPSLKSFQEEIYRLMPMAAKSLLSESTVSYQKRMELRSALQALESSLMTEGYDGLDTAITNVRAHVDSFSPKESEETELLSNAAKRVLAQEDTSMKAQVNALLSQTDNLLDSTLILQGKRQMLKDAVDQLQTSLLTDQGKLSESVAGLQKAVELASSKIEDKYITLLLPMDARLALEDMICSDADWYEEVMEVLQQAANFYQKAVSEDLSVSKENKELVLTTCQELVPGLVNVRHLGLDTALDKLRALISKASK